MGGGGHELWSATIHSKKVTLLGAQMGQKLKKIAKNEYFWQKMFEYVISQINFFRLKAEKT